MAHLNFFAGQVILFDEQLVEKCLQLNWVVKTLLACVGNVYKTQIKKVPVFVGPIIRLSGV